MSRLDSRLLRALDDWLFPERVACLCCDAALGGDDQSGLCPGCAQALSRLTGEIEALPPPAGIDEALAAFPYADQPRQLILMLKFNSVRAAALPLARAMSSLPLGVYDALVPVPTTRRRLRQRGFNQAQLLAERLGEIWGMPVLPALSRRDEHAAQTKLSAENRRRNLEGCMEAASAVCGLRSGGGRRIDHRLHRVGSRKSASRRGRGAGRAGYGGKNGWRQGRHIVCALAGAALFCADSTRKIRNFVKALAIFLVCAYNVVG